MVASNESDYPKVSKILHASEGLEEQSKQHAELLKTAAYAAEALAGQSLIWTGIEI